MASLPAATCGPAYDATVLHAAAWAGLAASTLLVGAWLGIVWNASQRTIGLVMGFGAGALIASVSFELTEEAFDRAGGVPLAVGLAAGALTYWVGDLVIDRMGTARIRRRSRCCSAPVWTASPSP